MPLAPRGGRELGRPLVPTSWVGSGAAGQVGLAVGVLGFLFDAKTKHIAHTLTTDVLLTERISGGEGGAEFRYHETQIVSGASKVNLKREEGLPAMKRGLSRALAGLLPNTAPVG